MSDLEMTKLCAEAMGWQFLGIAKKHVAFQVSEHAIIASNDRGGDSVYDPLTNDAQCMALVKRFGPRLSIYYNNAASEPRWEVFGEKVAIRGIDQDLNRAVVSCVAKMQAAK